MDTDLIEQNVHRLLGAMSGAATTAMVAVGDQPEAAAGRQLAGGAGFSRFRQVTQTPVNVVLELRP
ncbi:MAG TPA: hypothetical protein VFW50_30220 [Streptosporangiaceae bacterium]|nr:hypothetical protein [Streptosporangiaceae bacterium]